MTRRVGRGAGELAASRSPAPRGGGALLGLHNLDVWVDDRRVLSGVDVDVASGEILAILGTGGSGKSTLLATVTGLASPRHGTVTFKGGDLAKASPRRRIELGIVGVPAGQALFGRLSVLDNLLAGCHLFAWQRERVRARVTAVTELFPMLVGHLGQPAGTLSGGEQQMLAIAKALLLEPTLLLLDEPCLGLGPAVVTALVGTVAELRSRGMTVVIADESPEVVSIADRVVWLERGEVRFQGPTAALLADDDLVRALLPGLIDPPRRSMEPPLPA